MSPIVSITYAVQIDDPEKEKESTLLFCYFYFKIHFFL